jgi:hypothetical protein
MILKLSHPEKVDPTLLEALQNAQEGDTLSVIFLLDLPEPLETQPSPAEFPSRHAWQRAIVRAASARARTVLAPTIAAMRALGLDPLGWELGQAVVYASPAAIIAALELPGVRFGILDWDLKLYESLPDPSDTIVLSDNSLEPFQTPTPTCTEPGNPLEREPGRLSPPPEADPG